MSDSKELKPPQRSSSSPNKSTLPVPSSHTVLSPLLQLLSPFPTCQGSLSSHANKLLCVFVLLAE